MSDYRKSINNKASLTAVGMLETPVHDLPVQPSITVASHFALAPHTSTDRKIKT